MDKTKTNCYCVIEVLDPPYIDFDKYVCVPSSWLSFQETPTEYVVVVKFPIEPLSDTKRRIRKSEECSTHWNTFRINIKCTNVSYEHAQNLIKSYKKTGIFKNNYATNDRDGAALLPSFNTTMSTKASKLIPSPNKINKPCGLRPAVNQTKFKRTSNKKLSIKQIRVNESANSANIKNYFTRQSHKTLKRKMLSPTATKKCLHQNDEVQALSKEHSNNCIQQCVKSNNRESNEEMVVGSVSELANEPVSPIILVDLLKKIHADHLKFYTMVDEIRSSCRENCALLEQMIDLTVTNNNLSNSSTLAAQTEASERMIEKQNKTIKIDTVKKTVTDLPKEQQDRKSNHKKGKDEIIYIDDCEETMNANENVANDSHKDETASCSKGYQIRKFVLPKEYDKNDSRWTLKYKEKRKGLVELQLGTGVYVDAIRLSHCKRTSKDSKTLARMLLVEVFSANALSTCSLTGQKAKAFHTDELNTRPGLDEHARNVLLKIVEEYAQEQNWVKVDSLFINNTLRSKLQEMRSKAFKKSQKLVK